MATLMRTLSTALGRSHFCQPGFLLPCLPWVQPGGQMAEWELLALSQECHWV